LCKKENHKRFWLRIHITLRSPYVSVEDIDNSSFNNEFRLHCRSRSFIIYAVTGDQKKDWVQDLKRSIEGTHPEEKKKSENKKDDPETKDDVKKTKKDPTMTKPDKTTKDPEPNDPDTAPQKREERTKSKKPSKKGPKQEQNQLPFDPFAPSAAAQPRPNNNNNNPFLGVGGNTPQPNLIATAPLSGGNFDFGFNPSLGSLQVNMGLLNLNQPAANFNPNPNQPAANFNPNPNQPAANFNPNLNQPAANFNPNPLGVNPGANSNPFTPNVALNASGFNQPAANPYAPGGFSVAGTNPFTSGFNNQSMTVASNPFTSPVQNTNPFLNNPSSTPFSNQNPLF